MLRREFLKTSAGPCASMALSSLMARDARATNPLAARMAHHAPRAKSMIFMFMVGGPSQMDLFDPKPELNRMNGQALPESFGKPVSQFTKGDTKLLASTRSFKRHGQSGLWMSDLLPHLSRNADDICYLNGCFANSTVHAPAMYEMHSGRTIPGHPTLGAWLAYGLGSPSENLPAFCVLLQPEGTPEGGAPCWGPGYLPAAYQGTLLRRGASPMLHLNPPADISRERQQQNLDLIKALNRLQDDPADSRLAARTATYELAFRMQMSAPEAVDLTRETQATKTLYGLNNPASADFGSRLLLSRRLVERGVRFVQVYSGGGPLSMQWDAHDDINGNHGKMCGHVDQPISGLLTDLKSRGLLDETLVVWATEFGRLPTSQGSLGRDHNPYGFTMWMAGGGVKGGLTHGRTDELGLRVTEGRVSVNDFHATLLHLMGMDHEQLTFPHAGRNERLTDVAGKVIEPILA